MQGLHASAIHHLWENRCNRKLVNTGRHSFLPPDGNSAPQQIAAPHTACEKYRANSDDTGFCQKDTEQSAYGLDDVVVQNLGFDYYRGALAELFNAPNGASGFRPHCNENALRNAL